MTIRDIIKKAIEGGFLKGLLDDEHTAYEIAEYGMWIYPSMQPELKYSGSPFSIQEIVLRPDFWKCLGKAMGWGEFKHASIDKFGGEPLEVMPVARHKCIIYCGRGLYIYYWHKFIDHLAEGKSIESYFEQIN